MFEADLAEFVVFYITMEQKQYTVIYSIRSVTLSSINSQRKYTIIYNIRFSAIYYQ